MVAWPWKPAPGHRLAERGVGLAVVLFFHALAIKAVIFGTVPRQTEVGHPLIVQLVADSETPRPAALPSPQPVLAPAADVPPPDVLPPSVPEPQPPDPAPIVPLAVAEAVVPPPIAPPTAVEAVVPPPIASPSVAEAVASPPIASPVPKHKPTLPSRPHKVPAGEAKPASSAVDAGRSAHGQPTIDPAVSCGKPLYPAAAKQLHQTGSSTIKLLIGADGKVKDSGIEESSGFSRLDEAALKAFGLCRFKPAIAADGKPAEAWIGLRYVWRLDP